MKKHHSSTPSRLQLESLESRVVLSAAAHPAHALAHATPVHVAATHPTAHKTSVPSVPNPVLVNLTPSVTGITITDASFDKRVDLITIKGTVNLSSFAPPPSYYPSPTFPNTLFLSLTATQAVNQLRSVSGYQSLNLTVPDSTTQTVKFTLKDVATPGQFHGGTAVISLTESNYYYYNYSTVNAIVKLRNAKAY